ncbi:dTDP-4-dehydrorhamnose 3,5-epimerase [Roseomonas sp. NAR14]|uniref:dTDP-4-dehydrorhamnose 3,5-epimerase n=1 Tax=Roseomonas acroporae TaxID=2937791 RepID=A0A9X1YAK3_9PROT|nr:dTDP-4-dehydrorhamnose 3,5-epimerase [Roseomonas acroporae]MCK8787204.1 dTDP-4-dehydrorhamnose 3,5-epimerase [Roseomonas acroporae]
MDVSLPAAPPACGTGKAGSSTLTFNQTRGERRSGNAVATPFEIDGPLLIGVRRFGDARGFFSETYSRRDFAAIGVEAEFVQDNHSLSAPVGTVRGLHFQVPPYAQAKLVRVLRGAVLDVAVDLRHGSPTFGHHITAELSAANGLQLYVPVGFAHGFCTLLPDTEVAYKVSEVYAPDCDRGLAWDDPALGIEWPVAREAAVLSDKDRRQPRLADLPPLF